MKQFTRVDLIVILGLIGLIVFCQIGYIHIPFWAEMEPLGIIKAYMRLAHYAASHMSLIFVAILGCYTFHVFTRKYERHESTEAEIDVDTVDRCVLNEGLPDSDIKGQNQYEKDCESVH